MGPLEYPQAGALHGPFEASEAFRALEIVHTNVVHKRKPGMKKAQYTKTFNVRTAAGKEYSVKGGSCNLRGFQREKKKLGIPGDPGKLKAKALFPFRRL